MPNSGGKRIVALLALALAPALGAQEPKSGPVVELVTLAPGVLHSGLGAAPDPTQTYDLYLPSGFTSDRRWPLLMVFDPRSRGKFAAELFQASAERHGWIVASSNNTMSDGPFDPNVRAVNAMFPDLMRRLPVDPKRIYATGFSGGAILSWLVGLRSGQLAGVISVGGRPPDGYESQPPSFALWAAAGETDFNYLPTRELDRAAQRAGLAHRLEFFPGPHSWFDAAEAERAVAWLELIAMRDGLRPRDEAAIDAALASERAAAAALEGSGDVLGALRRWDAIALSFRGLRDVATAEARRAGLAASPAVRAAEKEEKWVTRYEEQGRRRIAETLALLKSSEPPPGQAKLRGTLGLDGLLGQAAQGGVRGRAAERVLFSVRAQFGFYLMRSLFASGDYTTAVAALQLATAAGSDNPATWYNLACAQAHVGSRRDALASLTRALDLGLPQPEQRETDADLAALRGEAEFARLVERARATAANPTP
jgi:dienelactone hydrolase